jgi:hypothetical protein
MPVCLGIRRFLMPPIVAPSMPFGVGHVRVGVIGLGCDPVYGISGTRVSRRDIIWNFRTGRVGRTTLCNSRAQTCEQYRCKDQNALHTEITSICTKRSLDYLLAAVTSPVELSGRRFIS